MAGIGFELRRVMARGTYAGLARAYVYAGVLSSGPWVLSILGVLIIGLLSGIASVADTDTVQFQVSVTYLIALSLIVSGFFQLTFTRFIADRIYENNEQAILPNYHGMALLVSTVAGTLAVALFVGLFADSGWAYRLLMLSGFVIFCQLWLGTALLSGMKRYRAILALFALGYGISVAGAWMLRHWGVEGLLAGFLIGQAVLLIGVLTLVVSHYPSPAFIAFDFLKKGNRYPSLIAIGALYNLGVWADKFLFWYSYETSQPVIGLLRSSVIYDLPVFLAYLGIIPGMAVFLLHIETDFVDYYKKFYATVKAGGSLAAIEALRDEMTYVSRNGLLAIMKIQLITVAVGITAAPWILRQFGISHLYLPLLYIDLVAVSLQVLFLGILTLLFYLDKRPIILLLCGLFAVGNVVFTLLSLRLGAAFYGYGYALALLAACGAGLYLLDKTFAHLEQDTFMGVR